MGLKHIMNLYSSWFRDKDGSTEEGTMRGQCQR